MILLLFFLASFFLYYIWQRRNLLRLAHKLKGLSGYPIFGSALKFLNADGKLYRIASCTKIGLSIFIWTF